MLLSATATKQCSILSVTNASLHTEVIINVVERKGPWRGAQLLDSRCWNGEKLFTYGRFQKS
jgi:hypothetical protein